MNHQPQPKAVRNAAATCPEAQKNLVNRCLGGDEAAWEAMVASQGPQIRSLVFRYPQLRAEVEDVKQEVFLKVYRNLRTFRMEDGNLSGWIIRIGRNLIIDRLRQNRHRSRCSGSDVLDTMKLADHSIPGPERNAIRSETHCILREKLRSLSPKLEDALTLRYVHEMSYQEIAGALGIPDGTAKSRVKRGRDLLAVRS